MKTRQAINVGALILLGIVLIALYEIFGPSTPSRVLHHIELPLKQRIAKDVSVSTIEFAFANTPEEAEDFVNGRHRLQFTDAPVSADGTAAIDIPSVITYSPLGQQIARESPYAVVARLAVGPGDDAETVVVIPVDELLTRVD